MMVDIDMMVMYVNVVDMFEVFMIQCIFDGVIIGDVVLFVEVVVKVMGIDKLWVIYIGMDFVVVECEQWDDGNNMLVLVFGVVVVYECNVQINVCLQDVGIEVFIIVGFELGIGCGGFCCMFCLVVCDLFQEW